MLICQDSQMDTKNAAPRPRQRDSTDCQDHRHRLKDTPLASPLRLSAGKALMLTPSLSSQTKTNSEIQGIATEEESGHRESCPTLVPRCRSGSSPHIPSKVT